MAQTQLDYRLGANNSIFDLKNDANVSLSRFDYSAKHSTTIDIGGIYPVDSFYVYPRDKVTLNCRYILDSLPLVAPTMTNYIVRTYWYLVNFNSVLKSWQTSVTKGRSGTVDKMIPSVAISNTYYASIDTTLNGKGFSNDISYCTPMSLSSYFHVPPRFFVSDPTTAKYLPFASANKCTPNSAYVVNKFPLNPIKFLAYQKIYRFGFVNPNLLQSNNVWFPEDTSDEWRVAYDGSNLSGDGFFVNSGTIPAAADRKASTIPSVNDNCVNIFQLRYASYERDGFTTAKPWLVRGTEAGLNADFSGISASLDFSDAIVDSSSSTPGANGIGSFSLGGSSFITSVKPSTSSTSGYVTNPSSAAFNEISKAFGRTKVSVNGSAKSTFTLNALRTLIAYSVMKERNTMTNGSYNGWQQVQWKNNPRTPDYEPYYLGGTSDVLTVGKVLQTSASSPDGNPLGSAAGVSSVQSKGHCFTHEFSDYGVVIGLMTVTPETVYSQGLDHELFDLNPEDYFMPALAKLAYQPVKNKEIYFTGNNTNDDGLFGYQTRFWYLKARTNKVSGLFLLPSDIDMYWSAYSQSRYFTSVPQLSLQFVTINPFTVRRDLLAYPLYPAFMLQFASDVQLDRALPYQSVPETFGF